MQIFILNQLPDLYKVLDPWDWHTSTREPSKQFMQPNDNNYELGAAVVAVEMTVVSRTEDFDFRWRNKQREQMRLQRNKAPVLMQMSLPVTKNVSERNIGTQNMG